MSTLLAVDVGGTFTDLVVLDADSGDVRFAKTLTTEEPEQGVHAVVERSAIDVHRSPYFFHGTTLGINAVLQRKGATTGVITTRGFRDVLEIARMLWPPYRLHWQKPEPLVPRYLRCEVSERVNAHGELVVPLDESEVSEAAAYLVANGVRSIAICFLHAYARPEHEHRARQLIEEQFPAVAVTVSHEVSREYLEYERSTTTVIDASIKPLMSSYVERLEHGLKDREFAGAVLLTRCDGGVMGAEEAKRFSVRTLVSGPASGVMGAAELGRWLELPNVIAADMGGTSFDAALIQAHEPLITSRTTVAGTPLLLPAVDLVTIGAGGGSIAWIDEGGALNVGPQSAGADPGPIAFGRGGTDPTFTDAALITGLLDADNFLGGEISLDLEAAERGLQETIAAPLGLELQEAASGIVELTEAKMASLLEELTIARGHDPRDFTLIAYGGGGPLVATALASRLSIGTVVIPPSPATFSAWGMLALDIVHDFAQTSVTPIDLLVPEAVRQRFSELEAEARERFTREAVAPERQRLVYSIDMRYEGQEHTLTIPLDPADLPTLDLEELRVLFDQHHRQAYGYAMEDPVEVTAYRIRGVGAIPRPRRPHLDADGPDIDRACKARRDATHRTSGGTLTWTIYERALLPLHGTVAGPAIIEEPSATVPVPPGWGAAVDSYGDLLLTRRANGAEAA